MQHFSKSFALLVTLIMLSGCSIIQSFIPDQEVEGFLGVEEEIILKETALKQEAPTLPAIFLDGIFEDQNINSQATLSTANYMDFEFTKIVDNLREPIALEPELITQELQVSKLIFNNASELTTFPENVVVEFKNIALQLDDGDKTASADLITTSLLPSAATISVFSPSSNKIIDGFMALADSESAIKGALLSMNELEDLFALVVGTNSDLETELSRVHSYFLENGLSDKITPIQLLVRLIFNSGLEEMLLEKLGNLDSADLRTTTHYEIEIIAGEIFIAVWDGAIDVSVDVGTGEEVTIGEGEDFSYAKIDETGEVTELLAPPENFFEGHSHNNLGRYLPLVNTSSLHEVKGSNKLRFVKDVKACSVSMCTYILSEKDSISTDFRLSGETIDKALQILREGDDKNTVTVTGDYRLLTPMDSDLNVSFAINAPGAVISFNK